MAEQLLTKAQLARLKSLMKTDDWDIFLKVIANYITEQQDMDVNGIDAFSTLRNLHTRDGKVAGIKEILERIERQEKI